MVVISVVEDICRYIHQIDQLEADLKRMTRSDRSQVDVIY
jgi:hypothetical protein